MVAVPLASATVYVDRIDVVSHAANGNMDAIVNYMDIDVVNLSDVKAAGANVSVPAVLGTSRFDECVDKDGDGGGSNYPRDSVCPSEGPRSREVRV